MQETENEGVSVGEAGEDEAGVLVAERAASAASESHRLAKRHKASSNYALERLVDRDYFLSVILGEVTLANKREVPNGLWIQIEDGFISPEAAIEHVSKEELCGIYRAIRVASANYESKLTTPEPVFEIKKIKKPKAKKETP